VFTKMKRWIGGGIARYLSQPISGYVRRDVNDPLSFVPVLRSGDLILVEGDTRFSSFIKYLTQSTWSHVAMYYGDDYCKKKGEHQAPAHTLIEAEINQGVMLVPLAKYRRYNLRILRPVGLSEEERVSVCDYLYERIGHQYDLRNVFDLLRFLLPRPPFFSRNRRQYLEFGSGDPTRAICSSIIAEAFQSIGYPILPLRGSACELTDDGKGYCVMHPTLFAPRDFDLSPYFSVVKPTLEDFDYRVFDWRANAIPDEAEEPSTGA
jgi:hypothetical protein